ncbi:MAG: nucleotidyltransferase domain-containing protein [Victivallales bacterium]|jgi:predicted nucleotidyltransferase|nr:nucleotidyltransferase domain-containing protein [Victivallales bacterium]
MKMQTKEIEQIKEKLVRQLSPEKIYLFGSFAEGTADEGSDVDIYIIVKDDTENLVDLTAEAYKSIRNVRSRAVDIIIGTESRFESRKNRAGLENEVLNKGVLLYG